MGSNNVLRTLGLTALTTTILSTSALAGGFDRGGVNIDLLFDQQRFVADSQVTYVFADRNQRNVQRAANVTGVAAPLTADEINGSVGFFVPRFGVKAQIGEDLNCLASYSEPFGADQENGANNALSASSVEFFIDTEDYGLTCSYSFSAGSTSVGDSSLRIIGGVSYQEFEGFLSRQSFFDFAALGAVAGFGTALAGTPVGDGVELQAQAGIDDAIAAGILPPGTTAVASPTNTAGLGTFSVSGDAIGWRAGVAYEIPDIALRASVVYNSSYDYDLTGIQDNTGFGIAAGAANATAPISATTEIPQSVEVKLQSGIAEGTLAFANFKWQDWSQLGIIPIQGGITAATVGQLAPAFGGGQVALPTTLAFEPLYRDGYTASVGIGRQFTEKLSGLASVTWDRGTSTTVGSQADTWSFSGGLNYKSDERLDIRFGGALGVLEGGTATGVGTTDQANAVTFDFDPDLLYAVNAGLKVKF